MNIVFNVRTVLSYSIIILFVAVPQMLLHFGLEHEFLTSLTSLWAIFIIILIAEFVLFWQYLRDIKTLTIALIIAIAIAFFLTSFFGA